MYLAFFCSFAYKTYAAIAKKRNLHRISLHHNKKFGFAIFKSVVGTGVPDGPKTYTVAFSNGNLNNFIADLKYIAIAKKYNLRKFLCAVTNQRFLGRQT